jgi:hypothetical protein
VLWAVLFSLLMAKEFFVGQWLRQHLMVYAISHLLIMPLLAMVVFGFATGRYLWQAPVWFWIYAFAGFFVMFQWEIARKIRAPDREEDGVDSYTKILGTYGAARVAIFMRAVNTVMVAAVGCHLGFGAWFYVAMIALFAICAIGFLQYRFLATSNAARAMETYASIYIIAVDVAMIVALCSVYGVTLGRVG